MISDTDACDGSWWTQFSWTVNALDWGARQGVRVTNDSNIHGGDPQSITAAYFTTRSAGMVHFTCAGNDGETTLYFPAFLPTVHSLGAAARYGDRASFSTYGPNVTIYAPGFDDQTDWGESDDAGDIDGDGDTTGADLGLFLSVWGPCD